jgi:2-keto-3-deoxy-L-rhamnonate aldolase RhmA
MADPPAFKARLAEGEPALGCWLETASPIVAEIVAQAGYDCVLIDMEHGPGSYMEAIALMQAVQGVPCAPLARVPANDPVAIKRILDCGVGGVMVPSVDTAEEAEAAVAACRYPPRGRRGMAATIVRASGYGARWRDYLAGADEALLVICQIETGAAVERAREIAAVDGVDMLFVGPFDLSASLGHLGAPDHPEVRARIAAVEDAAKSIGRMLGGIPTPERPAAELASAGYDLILADADIVLLREAARDSLRRLRAYSGDR